MVNFAFGNSVEVGGIVGLDEQNFGLIEVEDDDTIDWGVGVAVADKFEDFIGVEFEERGQFFYHQ